MALNDSLTALSGNIAKLLSIALAIKMAYDVADGTMLVGDLSFTHSMLLTMVAVQELMLTALIQGVTAHPALEKVALLLNHEENPLLTCDTGGPVADVNINIEVQGNGAAPRSTERDCRPGC